jgi:hypothetical protein
MIERLLFTAYLTTKHRMSSPALPSLSIISLAKCPRREPNSVVPKSAECRYLGFAQYDSRCSSPVAWIAPAHPRI